MPSRPYHRPAVAYVALASLACAVTLLAGCTRPSTEAPRSGSTNGGTGATATEATGQVGYAQGQTIVFDMGHGEVFGPDETSELGQSQAVARMREAGFAVEVNTDTITEQDLSKASGLFLAGPMRPLIDEEYAAINDFVERGGILVLTIHVPYPVLSVPGHWSLPITPAVMLAEKPLEGSNDQGVLVAPEIVEDPLTEGVSRILVVNGWPVSAASDSAKLVVKTEARTWADVDADKTPEVEEVASYGVIGSAGLGRGRVIVSGDDAVFANIAIGQVDNLRLLDNILEMMAKGLES